MKAGRTRLFFMVLCVFLSLVIPRTVPSSTGGRDYLSQQRGDPRSPFVIYYTRRYAKMAEQVARIVEDSSAEVASELGLSSFDTIGIHIAADKKEYMSLADGKIPEWSEACSDLSNGRLCINADAVLKSPRPLKIVVKHELSHLFMAQRVQGIRCPRWFEEGVAMTQSGEWTFSDHWKLLISLWRKDIPRLEELKVRFPDSGEDAALAYRISYIAVTELLADRYADLVTLTAFTRDTGDFEKAFYLTFSKSTSDFMDEFQATLNNKYKKRAVLLAASPFWAAAALFFLVIYMVKLRRSRKKLRRWEEEDKVRSKTGQPGY